VPKAEPQLEEWQTAVENLINAAEVGGGWLMLARMGVMRALNIASQPRQRPAPQTR
jgi:hypothetical protein